MTPCYSDLPTIIGIAWRDEHGETWLGVPDELGPVLGGPLARFPESDPRSGFKAFGGLRAWAVRTVELAFPKPNDSEALKRWPIDPADVPIDCTTEIRNVFVVRPAWVAFLARRLFAADVSLERIPGRLLDLERDGEFRRALDAAERLGGLDALRVACATIQLPLW